MESIPNAKMLAARYFGPARTIDNAVLFNCSLAIGTSLLIDGTLLRGAESNVGLIDSMLIPDEASGELSPLDWIAGGLGIISEPMMYSNMVGFEQAQNLTRVIKYGAGNSIGVNRTLEQAGRALGYAIMIVNSLLHPQRILLSGPMIESEAFCNAIVARTDELVGRGFADEFVKIFRISSQEAAQSLVIHHYLSADGFSRDTVPVWTDLAA